MSPRVLFEQDLETLKNKVSEMGDVCGDQL